MGPRKPKSLLATLRGIPRLQLVLAFVLVVVALVIIFTWDDNGDAGRAGGPSGPASGAACSSDRDCPAGERCHRYESGSAYKPSISGYCTSR